MRRTLVAVGLLTMLGAFVLGSGTAQAAIQAKPDRFVFFEGQRIAISIGDILDNDVCTSPCREPLRLVNVQLIGNKRQGKLRINRRTGKIIFEPGRAFTGTVAFRYTIRDDRDGRRQQRDRSFVRITVKPSPNGNDANS